MATIIVGGVVKKDGKYLLVQEAKKECKGKWSIPAGHLEPNETIVEGAKREILEECGLEVEITGILHVRKNSEWVNIAFSTNIIGGGIRFDKKEILDAKWFSLDDIINMKQDLRDLDWMLKAIIDCENDKIIDINTNLKI